MVSDEKPDAPNKLEVDITNKLEVDITVPAQKLEVDITVPADSEGHLEIRLKQCKLDSCKKALNPKRKDQEFCSTRHRKEFHNQQRKVG
jgi:hypothetical protein